MSDGDLVHEPENGDGWAVGSVEAMGDQYGFRKIRKELDVKEMGVNAIAMPPGYHSEPHMHERQEELYIVYKGILELHFNDSDVRRLGPGGIARVDASTVRSMKNGSDSEDMVYICIGAHGGYVGRDGLRPGGEGSDRPA